MVAELLGIIPQRHREMTHYTCTHSALRGNELGPLWLHPAVITIWPQLDVKFDYPTTIYS